MSHEYDEGVYGSGLYSDIGTPASTNISTWSFSMDGHPFVFIKLGDQGTLVYDSATGQWSAWNQDGNIGLGFNNGEAFAEFYLMGDPERNVIYTFDHDQIDDEDGEFTTILTGGLTARSRQAIPSFSVYVGGCRSDTDDREVTLFTSDDGGHTWFNDGTVSLSGNADEVGFRSLGLIRAPGRLFEIHDTGVFSSIQGLDTADAA